MLDIIDIFKAIFLGIIEGVTEFLPVSSTAHLLIASYIIDFQAIENNLFEIVIQFGAILAVLFVYHKRIFEIIFNLKQAKQQKFIINLIIAFLPAAIIGGIFHSSIKSFFFSNLTIALALIFGGIAMILLDYKPRKSTVENLDKIKIHDAFAIGVFQSIAMIPGISRSGATIIGGLLLGLNRKTAAEFSFFLAIPTITCASLFDLYQNIDQLNYDNLEIIFVGLLSAFISALLVIKWFIAFISKHNFVYFGIYRIIAGAIILYFTL